MKISIVTANGKKGTYMNTILEFNQQNWGQFFCGWVVYRNGKQGIVKDKKSDVTLRFIWFIKLFYN